MSIGWKLNSSLPKPTKEEVRRWQYMSDLGCIACALDGILGVPGDVHHLLSGGRRISHSHTVLLCPLHHRSVGLTNKLKEEGVVSLDANPKEFQQRYGTPQELLEIQNQLLTKLKETIS